MGVPWARGGPHGRRAIRHDVAACATDPHTVGAGRHQRAISELQPHALLATKVEGEADLRGVQHHDARLVAPELCWALTANHADRVARTGCPGPRRGTDGAARRLEVTEDRRNR